MIVAVARNLQSGLPATIQAAKVVNLNFQSIGTVSQVDVRPGQSVNSGQVLATENTQALQQALSADQAIVSADQEIVSSLQHPQLGSASAQALQVAINRAATALSDNFASLQSTKLAQTDQVVQAQSVVAAGQAELQSDQNAYAVDCSPPPTSTTVVGSTTTVGVTTTTSVQTLTTGVCLQLTQSINSDTLQIARSQSNLSQLQGTLQAEVDAAQAQYDQAQAEFQQAQTADAVANQAATVPTLNAAEVQLQQAIAAAASAKLALASASLAAPFKGLVLVVNGETGSLASSSGVAVYAYTPSQATQTGLNVFQSVSGGTNTSPASYQAPFLVMADLTGWRAYVQVPSARLSNFGSGARVKVTVADTAKTSVDGVVSSLTPTAVEVAGVTYFQVVVNMPGAMPKGVLPGMAATASPL